MSVQQCPEQMNYSSTFIRVMIGVSIAIMIEIHSSSSHVDTCNIFKDPVLLLPDYQTVKNLLMSMKTSFTTVATYWSQSVAECDKYFSYGRICTRDGVTIADERVRVCQNHGEGKKFPREGK